MSRFVLVALLFLSTFLASAPLRAQMPFYTDDTVVTEPRKLHIEVFDQFDGLQSRQATRAGNSARASPTTR